VLMLSLTTAGGLSSARRRLAATGARGTIDSGRDQVTHSETEQMLVNQSQPPGVQRDRSDGEDGTRADQ
jgi:hypothetical protein